MQFLARNYPLVWIVLPVLIATLFALLLLADYLLNGDGLIRFLLPTLVSRAK